MTSRERRRFLREQVRQYLEDIENDGHRVFCFLLSRGKLPDEVCKAMNITMERFNAYKLQTALEMRNLGIAPDWEAASE